MTAFIFGPFRLDLEAGELRRGSERIELRPKCFDLLVALVQNGGSLLSKEHLLATVWSDVVVSEAALTKTMAELREALSDAVDASAYIETVPKRGYRFVAPIQETRKSTDPSLSDFCLAYGAKEYPLREGDQIIGRGRDADIAVYSTQASRHHARIRVVGHSVTLEDLGSRNGTFVRDQPVQGVVPLKVGDQIRIGDEVLTLITLWLPTAETTPAPKSSA